MKEQENNNYKSISQKATAREITEELKPIKEGIEKLLQAITFPAYPSIELPQKEIQTLGEVATNALYNFAEKKGADKTFRIYAKNEKFYIGDKPIVIKDNNIIVDDEEYEGFWELIMLNNPKEHTTEDLNNHGRLMIKNNAIHRDNNPNNPYPVNHINGGFYLKTFGIIGKNMKEVELLLFRVILMHC